MGDGDGVVAASGLHSGTSLNSRVILPWQISPFLLFSFF